MRPKGSSADTDVDYSSPILIVPEEFAEDLIIVSNDVAERHYLFLVFLRGIINTSQTPQTWLACLISRDTMSLPPGKLKTFFSK